MKEGLQKVGKTKHKQEEVGGRKEGRDDVQNVEDMRVGNSVVSRRGGGKTLVSAENEI